MTGFRALLLAAAAAALKVPTRRELLAGAASSVAAPAFADQHEFTPSVVEEEFSTGKTGLLLLPPVAPLRNSYTWVRAAEDEAEAAGVLATNPAFKMAVSNSLTERGLKQASDAAKKLKELGMANPRIWYCTGRSSTQTADILCDELGIPHDRMMPEYVMLDARGFGAHEGIKLKELEKLHAQYDARSRYLKPIEGEDGSYAESVEDVFARVRSVLSNCETSRCGEEIVIVAPGADLLSIASAMLHGDDLRTHFKNKPPPGAVVHFGDMAATAKPWTPSKSNDPGPAWAAAERDRLTRAHDDRALVARAQARGHQDVDRLVDAHQDHTIRTARLDAQAAARQATADSQNEKNAATKAAAEARKDQARARRAARVAADRERILSAPQKAASEVYKKPAAAPAPPKPTPDASLELLPEDGLLAAIPLALAMAAVGGSSLDSKEPTKASYAAKPQAKEAWLKYKVSARKRREAEAAQRRAEEEAALKAAADEAALAAQREVLIHAKMPELEEPCDPLDELCKANYENESDDAWLAQISGIIADSSSEE
jgi:broad specificity phosphatase PhoE